ncbi:hypothetical protein F2Q69_00022757 [Brassica cretica]|uniref:Uncharacterized protein n=1 Tax=Brassica cretica TaxID=69181 RepID=A0A8S9QL11_BRACR|nr:hypothetical protein F2Q69_00022757 [Brassica cretica]
MSQLTFSEIATVRTFRSSVIRLSSPVANGSWQSRSVVVDEEAVAQSLQRWIRSVPRWGVGGSVFLQDDGKSQWWHRGASGGSDFGGERWVRPVSASMIDICTHGEEVKHVMSEKDGKEVINLETANRSSIRSQTRPHSQKQYSAPFWSFGTLIPKKPQIVLACVPAYKHPISCSPKVFLILDDLNFQFTSQPARIPNQPARELKKKTRPTTSATRRQKPSDPDQTRLASARDRSSSSHLVSIRGSLGGPGFYNLQNKGNSNSENMN